jgi:hypothetical protein
MIMKTNKLFFGIGLMALIFGLSVPTQARQSGAVKPPDPSQAGAPQGGHGGGK